MRTWIVEFWGAALNGAALITFSIWGVVFARKLRHHRWILGSAIIITLAAMLLGLWCGYRNYRYNTDSLHDYEDIYDQHVSDRAHAAMALMEYRQKRDWNSVTNPAEIAGFEWMLNFLEDIGYDEQHGGMSAEVAREGFYEDIVAYHQGAADYIANAQKSDPLHWEDIQKLFDDVIKVEAKESGRNLKELRMNDADYVKYLNDQMSSKNQ